MAKKKPKQIRQGRMVSVPSELHERMSKVDGENWSAISCRAFESRLGELAAQKEKKNMDDVITRLRATKNDERDEAYRLGKKHGESWAKDEATAAQLRRLSRHRHSLNSEPEFDWEYYFDNTGNANAWCSTAQHLGCIIVGVDPKEDVSPAEKFWESAVGSYIGNDDLNDGEYLRGFAEGAIDIWSEVEAKV